LEEEKGEGRREEGGGRMKRGCRLEEEKRLKVVGWRKRRG
jgi:hypothetical protein